MILSRFKTTFLLINLGLLASCHSSKENGEISSATDSEVGVSALQVKNKPTKVESLNRSEKYTVQGRTVLVANCSIDNKIKSKQSDPRIKDPCADKPIAQVIDIENKAGEIITQLKSNHIGEFAVNLAKDEYIFKTTDSAVIAATQKNVLVEGPTTVTIILKAKMPRS